MKRIVFVFLCILIAATAAHAQVVKVYGKVTNNNYEPLSYASVHLKNSSVGTVSKEDGTFELYISKGTYELVVSMMGYKTRILPMVVNDETLQNVVLEDDEQKSTLSEVVIKVKLRDRADEIMKKLVENKDNLVTPKSYSYKAYIKALQQDSVYDRKKVDTSNEFTGMAMAEVLLKVDRSDNKIKEERVGVKMSGEPKYLFYLSATDANINFYDNLISIPSISATPFVSPVSNTGLLSYKFKTLNIERRGRERLYTISVKPRALTNATIEGEITVSDSTWNIIHCRFSFPQYHLQMYSHFEVEQNFDLIDGKVWMLNMQKFTYYAKGTKNKVSNETLVTYADYELDKQFDRRHFNNELSVTTAEAYKRDSAFWTNARKERLSEHELDFVRYRDSLYVVSQSKEYLDSLDREINRITWKKLGFFGQTLYNREKERSWYLPPIISLYKPFAFGGGRINGSVGYGKFYPSRKNLFFNVSLSYGLRNKDINGSFDVERKYNPFKGNTYKVAAKREFQYFYEGDAWINLIKRSNIYLNNEMMVAHDWGVFKNLVVHTQLAYALRRSVADYKTGNLVDSLLGTVLNNNQPIPFEPYNALYSQVMLWYTPGAQYRREPLENIFLGSKWPTFYIEWRKGVKGILKSAVDFDYLEVGWQQKLKFGLLGTSNYTVRTGNFVNQKDLRLIDYRFERRGDPIFFMNPHSAFQALDSTFPTFKRFYVGHLVHEFNGFLVNKVPLLKKLQLREIAGAGFLFAKERSLRYGELFFGVERAFQSPFNPLDKYKVGVYVVTSAANKFNNPIQVKIGFTTWDKRRGKWY